MEFTVRSTKHPYAAVRKERAHKGFWLGVKKKWTVGTNFKHLNGIVVIFSCMFMETKSLQN